MKKLKKNYFSSHKLPKQQSTSFWSHGILGVKKWFFWSSKLCCPLWAQGKKPFLSTLNVMILQTVRNECVRFGGHVDIEVSYKIL
jgi:hypothetical protein